MNEELRLPVDALMEDYHQRIASLRRAQEAVRGLTAPAATRDGLVEVDVGPQGQLRAVRLDWRVYDRMPPHQLAVTIVQLAGEAGEDAAARVRDIMAPVLPGGLPSDGDLSGWVPGVSPGGAR
jgi:YbaB/EbfC DNA-binding family